MKQTGIHDHGAKTEAEARNVPSFTFPTKLKQLPIECDRYLLPGAKNYSDCLADIQRRTVSGENRTTKSTTQATVGGSLYKGPFFGLARGHSREQPPLFLWGVKVFLMI